MFVFDKYDTPLYTHECCARTSSTAVSVTLRSWLLRWLRVAAFSSSIDSNVDKLAYVDSLDNNNIVVIVISITSVEARSTNVCSIYRRIIISLCFRILKALTIRLFFDKL